MIKYLLIPFFIHFVFVDVVMAQELQAVATRFSDNVRTVTLLISIGAICLVAGKMMLGSKDAGPLFIQVSIGVGIAAGAGAIHSFITTIAG